MGTTSEKLTYLNTTKNLIKDNLNLGGANISNEPFRVYSSKLIDIYKDFLANGTDVVWNNWLPKVTGTGETITLNNTIEAKMDFVYKGNTSQESTTGKNLYDKSKISSVSGGTNNNGIITATDGNCSVFLSSGGYIPVNNGETIYFSADIKLNSSSSGVWNNINDGVNGGTKKILKPTLSTTYQRYQTSFTYSSNRSIDRIFIQIFNLSGSIEISNIMISKNNNANYEPYTGNQPSPNPDYPQDIQVVSGDNTIKVEGKNLFQTPNTQTLNGITLTKNNDGTFNLSGTATANTNMYLAVNLNDTKIQNGTYTLSRKSTGYNTQIDFYNGNSWLTTSIYVYGNNLKATSNVTIPNNATMVRFIIYVSNGTTINLTNEYVQLEKGSTSTTFQPYQSASYEIDLRTSKNLFDISAITRGYELNSNTGGIQVNANWWFSDYIGIKQNTDYTSSNISSSTKCWYDSNKNFISKAQAKTATSPANARYLRVNGTLASIESNPNLMIEEGDTATTYELYNSIELCKIGDYQDKIAKSTGKNLFDKSSANITANKYLNTRGEEVGGGTSFSISEYIKVEPNTIYTTQPYANMSAALCFYDDNKTFISGMGLNEIDPNFTTPSNCGYIKTSFLQNSKDLFQIEKGSIRTSYEPYGKVWYLNKQIGKVVLDGSESWNSYADGSDYFYRSTSILETTANYVDGYSSHFRCLTYYPNVAGTFAFRGDGKQLSIRVNGITSVAGWKTWLSTHNTTVYYVLATPTYEEITDTTLISQLEAIKKSYNTQTNISQTNDDKPFILDVVALGELD